MTSSPQEIIISIQSGLQKGSIYRMVSSRITIGRSAENDIVIDDSKMSRKHAEISFTGQGIQIRNLSETNHIHVDGKECKIAALQDQSFFAIGSTQFQLQLKRRERPTPLQMEGASSTHRKSKKPGSKSPLIPLLTITIIGFALWSWINDSQPKTLSSAVENDEPNIQIAEKIKMQALEKRRPAHISEDDISYQQAQQAYVEGFRDYRKGQFERALASFQACLSLFPQHNMCNRYLRLTQRKVDELIQYHLMLGIKYRDQNQYGACAASFRNVLVMVKDQQNSKYKEAKANYEACRAQVEERF